MSSSFTRRVFLKRTALATGALSAAPLSPNILAGEGATKQLQCVFIGCGGRAMSHLDWIVTQAKENVMAIVDPDEKSHAKVKAFLTKNDQDAEKVQGFTDYRRMYERIGKHLEVVFIATPNH